MLVDKGYRGVKIAGINLWRSGQKRGVNLPGIERAIHRRSTMEQMIQHIKSEGRLRVYWLKDIESDAIHAVLFRSGHNLRLILRTI